MRSLLPAALLVESAPLFEVMVVVVEIVVLFTTCVKIAEVLALKPSSPPYSAVMEWLPDDRVVVEKVAV